jgi:hypothetical protein
MVSDLRFAQARVDVIGRRFAGIFAVGVPRWISDDQIDRSGFDVVQRRADVAAPKIDGVRKLWRSWSE